jgi:hypothetical protein
MHAWFFASDANGDEIAQWTITDSIGTSDSGHLVTPAGSIMQSGQWLPWAGGTVPANAAVRLTADAINHTQFVSGTTIGAVHTLSIQAYDGLQYSAAQSFMVTTYGAGDSNASLTIVANNTIALGNGNNSIVGTSNETIMLGNGNNLVTVSRAGNSITVGNGTNTVTVGPDSSVTVGDGTNKIYAGADSWLKLGSGTNTIFIGFIPGRTTNIGNMEITSFKIGDDVIVFNKSIVSSFTKIKSLACSIPDNSGNSRTVIWLSAKPCDSKSVATESVTLDGMTPDSLAISGASTSFQFR